LTYEFYVQAFSVYEESISDSRAQLQAITIIIGTLQAAKVFGADNYDTLITKAALHGAKLLKKPHQATAVQFASHMWWQSEFPVVHGLDESDIKKVCDAWTNLVFASFLQCVYIDCSPYGMENEYSNACKWHCASPVQALKRS
jgi:hypothetical protein